MADRDLIDFNSRELRHYALAALVARMGGSVEITRAEFNAALDELMVVQESLDGSSVRVFFWR